MSNREVLTTIYNRHAESCGNPPEIDIEEVAYFSYFENSVGDQSIFLYDDDTDTIEVYLADAGWDKAQTLPLTDLLNNRLSDMREDVGVMPGEEEKMWLRACKAAIQGRFKSRAQSENQF